MIGKDADSGQTSDMSPNRPVFTGQDSLICYVVP